MVFESTQAKVVAITSLISLLLAMVIVASQNGIVSSLWFTILFALYALWTTYDINCIVMGSCNVWSWIKTVFILFYTIIMIVLAGLYISFGGLAGEAPVKVTKTPTPIPA